MQWYKADLHIHTVLSPCGGIDMSPVNIIRQAVLKKLDIIAITDHNSTRHCRIAQEIGKKAGITVLAGAEINTSEEIHCLAFFEDIDKADLFQQYIDAHMTELQNKPEVFGYQYIVDEAENILGEENRLLYAALTTGIDEISRYVTDMNGIFIPAHINRKSNGIYNQLGFLPASMKANALEVSPRYEFENFLKEHPETANFSLVQNSDAHSLDRIGALTTDYYLELPVLNEIIQALKNVNGRKMRTL